MLRFIRSEARPSDSRPRIVDGAGAKAWLAAMSQPVDVQELTEIAQVLRALGALGVEGGSAKLEPQRKFAIAERIRGVSLGVLGERLGESQFAVLPLEDEFASHFWAAIDAGSALRDVYAWLVSQLADTPVLTEATLTGTASSSSSTSSKSAARSSFVSGVGALHRALDVNAQMLLWVQRARWSVPTTLWERHCVLGQLVRDLDCQDVEVADVLHASITKTCRAAFVMPVLIALADPTARSAAEFEVVRMAAQRWAAKVGFRLERRIDVPTGAAAPVRPVASPGPSMTLGNHVLRLDTQSALQSIDKRLDALADGMTPREVGIGDSLRPSVARDLLMTLRQRWGAVAPTDIDSPDRAWRASSPGIQVSAMLGMPSSDVKRRDAAVARAAAKNTYAYHRNSVIGITKPRDVIASEKIDQLLASAEQWTLAAESPDAVRFVRKHARPRIGLQRLVGLKLGSADRNTPFLVGWVEALQGMTGVQDDGRFQQVGAHSVRVRLAPGVPQLLHASIDDVEVECAFLLVPGAGLSAPGRGGRPPAFIPMLSDPGLDAERIASLDGDGWDGVRASPRDYGMILPVASFRPQRLVKASRGGALAVLRLEELMMRGSDFDLVRFTLL